jgi:hypothetical protein
LSRYLATPEGVVLGDHSRPRVLKDPAGRVAAVEELEQLAYVDPASVREDSCLAEGKHRCSDDHLVAGFGDLPGTEKAEVNRTTAGRQDRGSRSDCLAVSTHHDRQRPGFGPVLAAGDGSVD